MEIIYDYFKIINGCRWFWSVYNGLYFIRDGKYELVFAYERDGIIRSGGWSFGALVLVDSRLFLIPRFTDEILIWDLNSHKITKLPLPISPIMGELFLNVLQSEDELVLMPRSYPGIVHVNKKNLQVALEDKWYQKYCNHDDFNNNNTFIFRALACGKKDIVYLAFYNQPQVLKYNIITRESMVLNTISIGKCLDKFEDDGQKFIIFNRRDCLQVNNEEEKLCLAKTDFFQEHNIINVIRHQNNIIFFAEDGIFNTDIKNYNIGLVCWYDKVREYREYYENRDYVKSGDPIEETLYIFKEGDITYVSFYPEKKHCMIRLEGDEISFECEDRKYVPEIELLIDRLKTANRKENKRERMCIGKQIFNELNNIKYD